jgi:hypothetical protein
MTDPIFRVRKHRVPPGLLKRKTETKNPPRPNVEAGFDFK